MAGGVRIDHLDSSSGRIFRRPPNSDPTPHLCIVLEGGPEPFSDEEVAEITAVAAKTAGRGRLLEVFMSNLALFLTFDSSIAAEAAAAALTASSGSGNGEGGGEARNQTPRLLHVRFAIRRQPSAPPPCDAAASAAEANISGLFLLHDFVTADEEAQLLAVIDAAPWAQLSKRRVQHYWHRFDYALRGVAGDPAAAAAPPPPPAIAAVAARAAARTAELLQQPQHQPQQQQQQQQQQLESHLENDSSSSHPALPIDQITVNEYPRGVGLAPHVDTHSCFQGPILSLSLGGPAVMEFRRPAQAAAAAAHEEGLGGCGMAEQRVSLALPPRSLLILSGEARLAWEHAIPARRHDIVSGVRVARGERRVSVTMRRVRPRGAPPCACEWPAMCDGQGGGAPPTRAAALAAAAAVADAGAPGCAAAAPPTAVAVETASSPPAAAIASSAAAIGSSAATPAAAATLAAAPPSPPLTPADHLEASHVHAVYDAIAHHFSATRFAVWPKVRAFLESLPAGAVVADAGCGNGKYWGVRRDVFFVASDRSAGLAAVAARRLRPSGVPGLHVSTADVAVADARALPLRAGAADAALLVAVLHHVSTVSRRREFLAELARVLRPGGRALVTVWAREQEDVAKTIARWRPLRGVQQQQQQQTDEESDSSTAAAAAAAAAAADGDCAEGGGGGGDYLVPWHLPFHRAGAAPAAAKAAAAAAVAAAPAGAAQDQQQQQQHAAMAAPRVDEGKRAVVFQRYIHLFARAELAALVAETPGARLIDVTYDRSNWVAEFERV